MDFFLNMTPAQAAALSIGLLTILMMALKMYVGNRRGAHKVASGDSHPEFNRAVRVQMNAVEDVPVLMAGIIGLALLSAPAWYIHMAGLILLVGRILHAVGLAGSSGFSFGRLAGTLLTMVAYLVIGGGLIYRVFAG